MIELVAEPWLECAARGANLTVNDRVHVSPAHDWRVICWLCRPYGRWGVLMVYKVRCLVESLTFAQHLAGRAPARAPARTQPVVSPLESQHARARIAGIAEHPW